MFENIDTTLVLGHAASGKSAWAEAEAVRCSGERLIYVATARVRDGEMRTKIALHAARRGTEWSLIEEPVNLATVCSDRQSGDVVLIDCATMWLTNLMMDEIPWQAAADAWNSAMQSSDARFVVVSNDVGGGVTPDNAMARAFQRDQGALNQQLAAALDRVVLVTAGLPQRLK